MPSSWMVEKKTRTSRLPNSIGKVEPVGKSSVVCGTCYRRRGLVDAAGKPRFNSHALGHFFAELGIEQGFSPKRLQSMLGHSSIQMTFDRLGHLFPASKTITPSSTAA
jgi:integrase